MSKSRYVVGVDLGGTKILGYALDLDDPHPEPAVARLPTPHGDRAIVAAMVDVVRQVEAAVGERVPGGGSHRRPAAVGVGAAGLVDRHGVLRFAPNLPTVHELDLQREIETAVEVPVVVANDATTAMVAEHRFGAARGAANAVLVTLGTGIGAGLVVGGEIHLGSGGFAGEPGHMVVDPNGPPCPCGRRGCWERFASGSGLGRLARDAAEAGQASAVVARAGGDPEGVRGEHVTQAALDGDPDAVMILGQFAWWVALGVVNLVHILDPEVLLIGGGLVDAADLYLPLVREAYHALVIAPDQRAPLRIEAAALGSAAGAIGAALLAGDRVS